MVATRVEALDLDPRLLGEELGMRLVEEFIEVPINEMESTRKLKIGSELGKQRSEELVKFLKGNLDVFAWTHSDMVGIIQDIMSHRLNIDKKYLSKRQKR